MAPGLIWVSTITPRVDGNLNRFSANDQFLATNISDFALCFKNTEPEKPQQRLTVYHVPDLASYHSNNALQDSIFKSGILSTGGPPEVEVRVYELVQLVERLDAPNAPRAGAMVTTCVDVRHDAEAEFGEWFDKQHMDMVSMCPGFVRGTRYQLVEGHPLNTPSPAGTAHRRTPKHAALYEYASTNLPTEQLKIVVNTAWSKKIIPCLTRVERDAWEYVTEKATPAAKGDVPRLGVI